MSHIKSIAIIGATGHVGQHIFSAVHALGSKSITVLTRESSTHTFAPDIKVAKVNYANHTSLVSALEGQDFLVISLSVQAPKDLHAQICKAAGEAGVPYIMPNVFGQDVTDETMRAELQMANMVYERVLDVERAGAAWFAMACGFWYEWSLVSGKQWYGFEIKERKVTFYDDGETKMQNSTWEQCGRAFAALMSLPKEEFEGFKNKAVEVASFCVSQRDMLDSLNRVLGTSDQDWEVRFEDTEKRAKDGLAEHQAGDYYGFPKMLYAQNFGFFKRHPCGGFEDANEKLGLKGEDLDEATKRAVGMVESGWSPFGQ